MNEWAKNIYGSKDRSIKLQSRSRNRRLNGPKQKTKSYETESCLLDCRGMKIS